MLIRQLRRRCTVITTPSMTRSTRDQINNNNYNYNKANSMLTVNPHNNKITFY